ncbi:MAG: hypothetical protein V4757_02185 [Pseudomonadota bacterium]
MRLHDWQLRFEKFAAEREAMPFAWGVNDCATFAAAAVEALTGVRHLPHLRGLLTAREAIKAQRVHGGLESIATQALGAPIAALMAGVGDVVLIRVGKRLALGVCNGSVVLGPGPRGMVAAGIQDAVMAWRVG